MHHEYSRRIVPQITQEYVGTLSTLEYHVEPYSLVPQSIPTGLLTPAAGAGTPRRPCVRQPTLPLSTWTPPFVLGETLDYPRHPAYSSTLYPTATGRRGAGVCESVKAMWRPKMCARTPLAFRRACSRSERTETCQKRVRRATGPPQCAVWRAQVSDGEVADWPCCLVVHIAGAVRTQGANFVLWVAARLRMVRWGQGVRRWR